MPLLSNSAAAPERRATTATIDTGTAVASGVVLATTAGAGSLDRCACELAARFDVRRVEIDGYVRTGDLFGVPLLWRRSLQLLVAEGGPGPQPPCRLCACAIGLLCLK